MTLLLCAELKRTSFSYQPTLDTLGCYIIDTLLLFQCFGRNDHHGNKQLCSGMFMYRKRSGVAILFQGVRQIVHFGNAGKQLVASHLKSSADEGRGGRGVSFNTSSLEKKRVTILKTYFNPKFSSKDESTKSL